MGRSGGKIGTPVTPRRQDDDLSREYVNLSGIQAPGNYTLTFATAHHQIQREVLDEKISLVPQRLLVQRMQNGVASSVGGGASTLGLSLTIVCSHTSKRPLVNPALLGS